MKRFSDMGSVNPNEYAIDSGLGNKVTSREAVEMTGTQSYPVNSI